MKDHRRHYTKLNITVTLAGQLISMLTGLIVPQILIGAFGSEAYGATTSISQFLAYIALVEGGIGGVARAALYRPLATNDRTQVGLVFHQVKAFFRKIAYIFLAYTVVLACTFKHISSVEVLDWLSTFVLVLVISLSTLAQYFIGSANAVLLQADQRVYITNGISIIVTVLNACVVVFMTQHNIDLIAVKFVSGCVFALKPVFLWFYVRRKYGSFEAVEAKNDLLPQKWTGLGQHIAFFLHSHTDVIVLTVFADLKQVAVYAVYNTVVSSIEKLTSSFAAGMESLFGSMLAKKEYEQLNETFNNYERMISLVTTVLLSSTMSLILPFIRLYTRNIADAEYLQPVFAALLILSTAMYCLRKPYHAAVMAAGHFKQTRAAAYGEAAINIVLSIMLVKKIGLVGVAIGTLTATLYRFVYYAVYLSKNIMQRSPLHFIKQMTVNALAFFVSCVAGNAVIRNICVDNYGMWLICGVTAVLLTGAIAIIIYLLAYHDFIIKLLRKRQ